MLLQRRLWKEELSGVRVRNGVEQTPTGHKCLRLQVDVGKCKLMKNALRSVDFRPWDLWVRVYIHIYTYIYIYIYKYICANSAVMQQVGVDR